jgi:hypothetical protein
MPGGRVVALDVDTRFHQPHPGVELREQDVTATDIGDAEYGLVHARGVLQHVAQREEVLDKMVAAAKPGGWVVLTDSDWVEFDAQPIPEPFGELSRLLRRSSEHVHGYDPTWGRRLLPALQERGLIDAHVDGAVYTMHGGTPSAELPAALDAIVRATRPGGHVVLGYFEPAPDPAPRATIRLRTIRDGGCTLEPAALVDLLDRAGCTDVRVVERTWPVPLGFVVGRKP